MSVRDSWTGACTALGLVLVLLEAGSSAAATFTINSGDTVTTSQALSANQSGTIDGTLSTTATSIAVTSPGNAPGVVIVNSGSITSANNRGIDATGALTNGAISLTNNAGGVISGSDDGFRINNAALNATITVENSGTIESTAGGQALDFNSIATATSVTINNNAGGLMQSNNADGVRTGQGAVLNNRGTINVTATSGNNDGVDLQANVATINNFDTGNISGTRHGITTDTNLSVTNHGSITGRNGSGVGSDGDGTVVNHGTITGAFNQATGDGDGVDIDNLANITNHGTIQGTGADNVTNRSEGIAAGGGTIMNMSGAKISGFHNGILIDDSSTGAAPFALNLSNAGTIEGQNGFGLRVIGTQNDTVTNSGTITAAVGPAIDLGGGDDTLKLQTGSSIAGKVDGGDGSDKAVLSGGGTLPTLSNFEAVKVESGTWIVLLSGVDLGSSEAGFGGEFDLETLLLHADAILSLDSVLSPAAALYAARVLGVELNADGVVTNIFGNGHNIYYDATLAENAYLHGASYDLTDGGRLIGVPEPASLALLLPAAALLLRRRRGR